MTKYTIESNMILEAVSTASVLSLEALETIKHVVEMMIAEKRNKKKVYADMKKFLDKNNVDTRNWFKGY